MNVVDNDELVFEENCEDVADNEDYELDYILQEDDEPDGFDCDAEYDAMIDDKE